METDLSFWLLLEAAHTPRTESEVLQLVLVRLSNEADPASEATVTS